MLFKRLFLRKPKQIKLGLALGSGGAKGFAEIGALVAFKENNVEFDVVAGSSIGSIIGAFYANGYSALDMLQLLKTIDMSNIVSLFMIKMDTSGLFSEIEKALGNLNIEQLKKPFRAIATNLDTGEEYVFDKGSVALATAASSSYQPYFKPVIVNGERYVDGAYSNSVPSDVVKKLGADYIVGIDLSNHNAKPTVLQQFFPTFKRKTQTPWEKGYEFANVMLHPNLDEFSPMSFASASKMYDIGYQCAMENMPQILKDISLLKAGKKLRK
jgi:NTE family protein